MKLDCTQPNQAKLNFPSPCLYYSSDQGKIPSYLHHAAHPERNAPYHSEAHFAVVTVHLIHHTLLYKKQVQILKSNIRNSDDQRGTSD